MSGVNRRAPQANENRDRPAYLGRAELLLAQGRPGQARSQLDPLIGAVRDPKGGLGIYLGPALLLSSRIDVALGRTEDAESAAEEALSLFERRARQPEQSADVGEALLVLAQAKAGANDATAARAPASRAVVAPTNSLGADHPLSSRAQPRHCRIRHAERTASIHLTSS